MTLNRAMSDYGRTRAGVDTDQRSFLELWCAISSLVIILDIVGIRSKERIVYVGS